MRYALLIALASLFVAEAHAEFGSNMEYGSRMQQYGSTKSNGGYPYESNSGTRYRYNLNNPMDRMDYRLDPGAQVMDRINPMVEMDRRSGQYGGDAKW